MRTKENHAGVALAKRFFDCGLPGITGNKVPLVEPAGEPTPLQFASEFLDQRLLGAVMREERMIALLFWPDFG